VSFGCQPCHPRGLRTLGDAATVHAWSLRRGFWRAGGQHGVCDRLPAAPRQRLIAPSGPLMYRKRASGVIAACCRFVAWLGLTNLLCLQKALLGVTVAAVILAGSASVKKVPCRPSLALSRLADHSRCSTSNGLRLPSLVAHAHFTACLEQVREPNTPKEEAQNVAAKTKKVRH